MYIWLFEIREPDKIDLLWEIYKDFLTNFIYKLIYIDLWIKNQPQFERVLNIHLAPKVNLKYILDMIINIIYNKTINWSINLYNWMLKVSKQEFDYNWIYYILKDPKFLDFS